MSEDSFTSKPWQAKISRRRFIGGGIMLAGAAGLAGYLPDSLARAASASAATRGPFDLRQVRHFVFVMQENRSFDQYFGTFPGVAGFSDPRAVRLPSGLSVFHQPDPLNPDGFLEPFHASTINAGGAAIPTLSIEWRPQHRSWNSGSMDGFVREYTGWTNPTTGSYTMAYYKQEDLPFHWALAKAFTICDHYHCSVLGATDPNRLFWGSGTNDPQGLAGGPVLETNNGYNNLTWESGAETLFNAGITFKRYRAETFVGPSPVQAWGPQWQYFAKLQSPGIVPDALFQSAVGGQGTLWGDGTPGGLGDPANPTPATSARLAFEEDCANGVLPDVSFLDTYEDVWEHPPGIPAAGAQFLASKLEALAANEELWNSTVVVINYDENGGTFDHVPPPVPDRAEFPEEYVTKTSQFNTPGLGYPVGAGFRVPCVMISPWSTGGKIFSEVSDHTSCLRMIEAVAAAGGLSGRGPVTFPNISRWRRQTFGNMTNALSGGAQPAPTSPEFDPTVRAANTAAQMASSTLPLPAIPGASQTTPVQLKR